jgi:murein DD-endopeptidase MepM/ murein hydrolase activator NlpD
VKPELTTATRVEATVPEGAISGRIRVVSSTNAVSNPSSQIMAVDDRAFTRTGRLTITDASTTPRRAFQFGMRRPVLSFVVNGSTPKVDLRVDIVNSRGDVIRSRFLSDVSTGSITKVGWAGLVAKNKTAPNGAYRFVVRGNDGTPASLSTRLKRTRRRAARTHGSAVADPFSFRIYGFEFPLRAPHTYGDGIGAPRAGHTHQGQDVMARCGSPLVAARAGVVYYNRYDSGAGYYLVINVRGNGGRSHVYMHMPRPSPLKVGTRVKTGQPIGRVGQTGAASACHLHFEIWSGPGWYQGGTFLNPTPSLRAWDRYS